MKLQEILELINNGDNLLFHGPGGTGKTFTIQQIYESFRDYKNIKMVTPTGIAAVNLHPDTVVINSLFRIPPIDISRHSDKEIESLILEIAKKNENNDKLIKLNLLIVDEISMVGSFHLTVIDFVLKYIRNNSKPMGGVHVIFSGDYYQLCPVKDDWGFHSKVWDKLELKLVEFNDPKRYTNLETFEFLERLRKNKLTDSDRLLLESRKTAYENKEHKKAEIMPAVLYPTNRSVNEMNTKKLNKLPDALFTSVASDSFQINARFNKELVRNKAKKELDEMCPNIIEFKKGAKILLTKNIDITLELVNGTLGKIEEINGENVLIKTEKGSRHWISKVIFSQESKDYKANRSQYPFKLAWAITIHKCQGLTLNSAIIDLTNIFTKGQAYVGISRVKNIENLFIIGRIDYGKIVANTDLPKELEC